MTQWPPHAPFPRPFLPPAGQLPEQLFSSMILLATLLSPYVWWRVSSEFFITVSDVLYLACIAFLAVPIRIRVLHLGPIIQAWLGAFALMLFGLLISSLFSANPERWIGAAVQYSFAYVVVPALLMVYALARSSEALAAASLAGVVMMQAIGASLYFIVGGSHTDVAFLAPDFISGAKRLGAFTNEANWNGAIIAQAIPLLVYFRCTEKLTPGWTMVIGIVLFLGLILAASATALFATTAALVAFYLAARIRPPIKVILLIVGVAGLVQLSGYALPSAFEKRIAPALETGSVDAAGTFVGRRDLIVEAWDMVEDTTVLGVGVDQYREASVYGAPVHNVQLLLWVEGGLISLLGWLAMMVILLAECAATLKEDRYRAAAGFGVLAAFTVLSLAAAHMYARIWVVPLVVAMMLVLDRTSAMPVGGRRAPLRRPDVPS